MQIEMNGETYTDWIYDPTSWQVKMRNTQGRIVLQWASYPTELWIIVAFFVGSEAITIVILIKKRDSFSFSKMKS